MARFPALIVAVSVLALPALTMLTTGVPAADAATCHFVLGFKALHHQIAAVIGPCLGDEQHNPANGDALQLTRKGTLVWRKADNQVAFTDGYSTIMDGPKGLEKRLNSQRFSWEANPEGLPVVPDALTTASQLRRQFAGQGTPLLASCSTSTLPGTSAHRTARKAGKSATARAKTARQHASCPQ